MLGRAELLTRGQPPRGTAIGGMSRRALLRRGGLAGAALLLSACTAPSPAQPPAPTAAPPQPTAPKPSGTTAPAISATAAPAAATAVAPTAAAKPAAAASGTTFAGALLPTYVPSTLGARPDLPSTAPNVSDGFLSYPKDPPRAIAEPPGRGGEVNFFVPAYYPPATPLDQNPAWQEVNRQLNATIRMDPVPLAEASIKLSTLMASDVLPDVIHFSQGWNAAPNLPQFVQAKCEDLTPFLSGDAIKAYPNLAAIPTYAWRNCVYNGKLYTIPIHRPAVQTVGFKNSSVYEKEFGADYVPKNADDFKRMLTQVTRPQAGQWGYGAYVQPTSGVVFDIIANSGLFTRMFKAPNQWRVEGGKLVHTRETEEFRAAVGYVRELWSASLIHPDTPGYNGIVPAQESFLASKFVFMSHSMAFYNDLWRRGIQLNPPVLPRVMPLISHDGSTPIYHLTSQIIGTTSLKKAPRERIEELLRIMNWLAAPFGTQEDRLIYYGIPEVDYEADENGNPRPTERGTKDANYVPWRYFAQRPWVWYDAGLPEFAKELQADEQRIAANGIPDPTVGLYSPTNSSRGAQLTQTFTDGLSEIVRGTRPLSELNAVVNEWRNAGGETIRSEYQQALAAAG
jgi:putative aldouronate transport system substrate-binding protein